MFVFIGGVLAGAALVGLVESIAALHRQIREVRETLKR